MGKFTISMAIFNNYVNHYQRVIMSEFPAFTQVIEPFTSRQPIHGIHMGLARHGPHGHGFQGGRSQAGYGWFIDVYESWKFMVTLCGYPLVN